MKQNVILVLRLAAIIGICMVLIAVQRMAGDYSVEGDAEFVFVGTENDADAACFLSNGTCVVIDTGEAVDGPHLVEVLRRRHVEQIDCMILTHPDQDHTGGASVLLEEFPVKQIITPYYSGEKEIYNAVIHQAEAMHVPVTTLSRERQFMFGGIKLNIYPPDHFYYEKSNNYSLGILAEHGDVTLFLAGDAEKKRIEELLERNLPTGIDLYKVAHHGRNSNAGAELIEKLCPKNAVVTALQPESEIADALSSIDCAVYTTVHQDVCFVSDQKQLKLQTMEGIE